MGGLGKMFGNGVHVDSRHLLIYIIMARLLTITPREAGWTGSVKTVMVSVREASTRMLWMRKGF